MKILECSSRGDKRFSAFYAYVNIDGKLNSIENHYQLAKRFGDGKIPISWKECKGKKPINFVFRGKVLPLEKLSDYYDWLWKVYLDENPELVEFLKGFDEYSDCFGKIGCNNQAVSIKKYMLK